ncbi:MAG: hypothetical protein Q7S65_05670 [Nanoarchaeota archaeon]|nr:hypothetical protein [Nanoarchaeota archaeon]
MKNYQVSLLLLSALVAGCTTPLVQESQPRNAALFKETAPSARTSYDGLIRALETARVPLDYGQSFPGISFVTIVVSPEIHEYRTQKGGAGGNNGESTLALAKTMDRILGGLEGILSEGLLREGSPATQRTARTREFYCQWGGYANDIDFQQEVLRNDMRILGKHADPETIAQRDAVYARAWSNLMDAGMNRIASVCRAHAVEGEGSFKHLGGYAQLGLEREDVLARGLLAGELNHLMHYRTEFVRDLGAYRERVAQGAPSAERKSLLAMADKASETLVPLLDGQIGELKKVLKETGVSDTSTQSLAHLTLDVRNRSWAERAEELSPGVYLANVGDMHRRPVGNWKFYSGLSSVTFPDALRAKGISVITLDRVTGK